MSKIDHNFIGRAFSVHTFMGSAGSALAPATLIFLTGLWNWKVALMIASAVSIVIAFALASQMGALAPDVMLRDRRRSISWNRGRENPPPVGARVLLTPPVLLLFLFFLTTTLPTSGVQIFFVAALTTLHNTTLATANAALTGYLVTVAAGVLISGVIADKTTASR